MNDIFKSADHNPPHLFRADTIYMITASTYQKKPIIWPDERKAVWQEALLRAARLYGWIVIAWVVLDNHYHALVEAPDNPLSLSKFIGSYHKFTARQWNDADGMPGRQVWWNYWDTCIRSEKDFLNRLQYVFWNPVKHGLAETPEVYPFSNYRAFLENQGVTTFAGLEEVTNVPEF